MFKTSRVFALVMVMAAGLVAGCGGDDDGSADCQKGCMTAASLKCSKETQASCEAQCQQLMASPTCNAQIRAAVSCTAARPASDFMCDADEGEAELKAGVCEKETEDLFTCILGGS